MEIPAGFIVVEFHLLNGDVVTGLVFKDSLRPGVATEFIVNEARLPHACTADRVVIPRQSIAYYVPYNTEQSLIDMAVQKHAAETPNFEAQFPEYDVVSYP